MPREITLEENKPAKLHLRSSTALLLVNHEASEVFHSLQTWIYPIADGKGTCLNIDLDVLWLSYRTRGSHLLQDLVMEELVDRLFQLHFPEILKLGGLSFVHQTINRKYRLNIQIIESLQDFKLQDVSNSEEVPFLPSLYLPYYEDDSRKLFVFKKSSLWLEMFQYQEPITTAYIYLPQITKVSSSSTHLRIPGRDMSICRDPFIDSEPMKIPLQSRWIIWSCMSETTWYMYLLDGNNSNST